MILVKEDNEKWTGTKITLDVPETDRVCTMGREEKAGRRSGAGDVT